MSVWGIVKFFSFVGMACAAIELDMLCCLLGSSILHPAGVAFACESIMSSLDIDLSALFNGDGDRSGLFILSGLFVVFLLRDRGFGFGLAWTCGLELPYIDCTL